MSNAQELLSILNGRHRPAPSSASSPSEKSILSFKAGKMNTTAKPNGKYLVEADTRRGELHLVYARAMGLKLEWKDRRTKATVNTVHVPSGEDATFERVETGREGDRVYILQVGEGAGGRHFFWMQDRDASGDENICVKVNLYLSDAEEAKKAAGFEGEEGSAAAAGTGGGDANEEGGMDNDQLLRIMQGALGGEQGRAVTVPGSGSIPAAQPGQIDALGNILENLGVPQPGGSVPSGEHTSQPTTGGLTLADLQGAMEGLATASPVSSPGPPLSELASPQIIDESGIMDDPDAVARLVALLPENQRSNESLRENLRSPQVAQCLQRLTAALADDASSFNSIIANFQLDQQDGGSALAQGNPIEAFLNCVLKDVEKKEGVKKDGSGEKKDDDGDEKMDESEN